MYCLTRRLNLNGPQFVGFNSTEELHKALSVLIHAPDIATSDGSVKIFLEVQSTRHFHQRTHHRREDR